MEEKKTMKKIKTQKILLLGNGVNLAFTEEADKYREILNGATAIAKNLAIKGAIFEDYLSNKIITDPTDIGELTEFRKDQIRVPAKPREISGINYYNRQALWDSETILSVYFISKAFQDNMLTDEAKNKIKEEVRASIINAMNSIPKPKFIYKKQLIKKLNEYDFIITTNYDSNLEILGVKPPVVHLHGSMKGDLVDLKMGPFADLKKITEKVSALGISYENAVVDIFGLSMITEPHIFINLFSKEPTKINHYVYNLDTEGSKENLWDLINSFYGNRYPKDLNNRLMIEVRNGNDAEERNIKKAIRFKKKYEQFPSSEFIESSNVDGVNETMMPSLEGVWE